ncbi:MAG: dual specificity protein phosphatase family protein [Methanosarcinales archaeon]
MLDSINNKRKDIWQYGIEDSIKKVKVPFPRSYWIIPYKFLAGYYPGSEKDEIADQKLKGLIDSGIRHIINLMEKDEVNWSGKPFNPYKERIIQLGKKIGVEITVERIPIVDRYIPTKSTMKQILNHIDRNIKNNRPVYVHCWGGRGRTGTVVGCYLARHGITGEYALKKIKELRRFEATAYKPSPDNELQRNMVIGWKKGQ